VEARLKSKMQQEPNLEIGCAKIIQQLTLGDTGKLNARLRFDDEALIDDHVDSLHGEDVPLVRHVDTDLPRDVMAPLEQFTLECHNVNMLEKAESKRVVHLEERANDRTRESLFQ
jgi:hypothetical protein